MKKLLLLTYAVLLWMNYLFFPPQKLCPNAPLSYSLQGSCADSSETIAATVYICTGPKSECYHSYSKCRGLNSCSASIKPVSEEKAIQMKRRRCKLCYK